MEHQDLDSLGTDKIRDRCTGLFDCGRRRGGGGQGDDNIVKMKKGWWLNFGLDREKKDKGGCSEGIEEEGERLNGGGGMEWGGLEMG